MTVFTPLASYPHMPSLVYRTDGEIEHITAAHPHVCHASISFDEQYQTWGTSLMLY